MAAVDGQNETFRYKRLLELAGLFFRLGTVAFGGPAAHISMFREEVVRRRQWIDDRRFLDLLGATSLIPGPNSTEMAIHIGLERARWAGLVVAGVCFILPAFVFVTGLTWVYVEFGQHLVVAGILYGIKPVVIAVVAKAITGLSGVAFRRPRQVVIAVAALGLYLGGTNEILLMFGSGSFGVLFTWIRPRIGGGLTVVAPLMGLTQTLPGVALNIPATFSLASLFLVFLKIGAVLYGSGYVLVTFLERDLVDRLGWLTQPQLLDVIAIGQVTPGPVFTTATAIGYVMGGLPGAAVATVGIFLPSFLFVAMVNPLITYLRSNTMASAFLDGVNAGAIALMAGVALTLGRAAIVDAPSAVVGIGAAYLLVRRGVSPTWLIPVAAVIGVSCQWGLGIVSGGL